MQAQPLRKSILDRFETHLKTSYEHYCERHNIERSETQLLSFLIDQDLISNSQIQKFAIQREFESLCQGKDLQKTQVVYHLADRFRLSERTIWGILKSMTSQEKSKKQQQNQ